MIPGVLNQQIGAGIRWDTSFQSEKTYSNGGATMTTTAGGTYKNAFSLPIVDSNDGDYYFEMTWNQETDQVAQWVGVCWGTMTENAASMQAGAEMSLTIYFQVSSTSAAPYVAYTGSSWAGTGSNFDPNDGDRLGFSLRMNSTRASLWVRNITQNGDWVGGALSFPEDSIGGSNTTINATPDAGWTGTIYGSASRPRVYAGAGSGHPLEFTFEDELIGYVPFNHTPIGTPAVLPFTWDPHRMPRSTQSTLSNGNLTFTVDPGALSRWRTIPTQQALGEGKWYWEILMTVTNGASAVGVGDGGYRADAFLSQAAFDPSDEFGIYRGTGVYVAEGVNVHLDVLPYDAGDTVMVAIDTTGGDGAVKLWIGRNGTWPLSGDPATGANPLDDDLPAGLFPSVTLRIQSATLTANFGQSAFTYTPPSGFVGPAA